jgi:hypothetical protein
MSMHCSLMLSVVRRFIIEVSRGEIIVSCKLLGATVDVRTRWLWEVTCIVPDVCVF